MRALLAAIFALASLPAAATPARYVHPDYFLRSLAVADGLPVNATTAVAIDRSGYLWVATWDGLARYDGRRIVPFRTDTEAALASNRIRSLALDGSGVLWLLFENGRIGRVRDGLLAPLTADVERELGTVLTHRVDTRGQLWLASQQGVFVMRDGEAQRRCTFADGEVPIDLGPIDDDATLVGTHASGALRCDRDGLRPVAGFEADGPVHAVIRHAQADWIIDWRGLHRIGDDGPPWIRRWTQPSRTLDNYGWLHLAAGQLWVRTMHEAFAIDGDVVDHRARGDARGFITRFAQAEASGVVWLVHGTRLYRDDLLVVELPHQINDLQVGSDGIVWLATDGGGVVAVRARIGQVFLGLERLDGANLYAVAPSRRRTDTVWLGGQETGLLALIGGATERLPVQPRDDGIVWSILEDDRGRVWQGGAVLCLRRDDNTCESDGLPPGLLDAEAVGRQIRLLMQDRSGAVWIGSAQGLFRHEAGRSTRIEGPPDGSIVRTALERRDGSIWFGTSNAGLYLWRDGRLEALRGDPASRLVRSLYEDGDGTLWVGTEDRGLLRLAIDATPAIVEQRVFGPEQGMWDDVIHFVAEDRQGRLWMNSNRGIFWVERAALERYTPASPPLPVVGYTEDDGLLNREGNGGGGNAGLMQDDGVLWLPGQAGLVRIDTTRIARDARAPQPVIETARAADDEWTARPAALVVPATQRDLAVTYTAPAFRHADRTEFRYRLVGHDADWRLAGTRREAIYTNLPAGDFRFELSASTNGDWSEPALMAVQVLPRIYERGWFQVASSMLLLALLIGAWRWRVAALHREADRLQVEIDERTADVRREQRATEGALAEVARTADRLRELDAAKSRFFTNLSHELRTPLTLIVGPAEQAISRLADEAREQTATRLRSIRDNGQRLLDLVNQIQDLSRLEAGYRPLRLARGDLAAACRDLVQRFGPMVADRGQILSGPAAGARCDCLFDRDAIDKIVGNLLGNALKHTPRGGRIALALREVTGGVVVRVSDEGRGIAPDQVARVFDRFYTAEHEGAGSGIGLALARELANLHGGHLDVESRLGHGSVFTLVLPLEIEHWNDGGDEAAPHVDATTAPLPSGTLAHEERTTVLVVDDQPEVRRFIVECLAPHFRVLEAEDGASGLETARRELPDLVVSDVMMPQVDGLTLARRLAGDPATRTMPVILLTARASIEDEITGLGTGAIDYLTKPFAPEILLSRIRRLLGYAQRLREQLRAERVDRERVAQRDQAAPDLATRLERAVLARLDDETLDVDALAHALHSSRSSLKRAMSEAGLPPPSVYIRELRLREAAALLARGRGNVGEVAYAVGFASLSHFTHRFRDRYGVTPSAYAARGEAGAAPTSTSDPSPVAKE